MKTNRLPSVEELNKLFRYEPETGKLYRRKPIPDDEADNDVGCIWTKNIKHSTTHGQCMIVQVNGKIFPMHRIIYKMIHGDFDESLVVDHIDGDGLNNRPDNLRAVTPSVNKRNSVKKCNNTSGVTGVWFDKRHQKWCVRVWLDGNRINLGRYHDKENAAKAAEDFYRENGFTDRHGK